LKCFEIFAIEQCIENNLTMETTFGLVKNYFCTRNSLQKFQQCCSILSSSATMPTVCTTRCSHKRDTRVSLKATACDCFYLQYYCQTPSMYTHSLGLWSRPFSLGLGQRTRTRSHQWTVSYDRALLRDGWTLSYV